MQLLVELQVVNAVVLQFYYMCLLQIKSVKMQFRMLLFNI